MKVLKIAAIVVGTVAGVLAIASGLGAPIGAGILGVSWGTIAAGAGLVGALLNVLDPPKPPGSSSSAVGSQTSVTLDPQAGSPYVIGRTFYAGTIVEQDTFGTNNEYIGTVFVYGGGGPYHQFEAFQASQVTVTFSGGAATSGGYGGFMWLATQLGACPESAALASSQGTLPGWGSSSKLSGYCASLLTLKFDKNGKVFAGGYPQVGAIIQGALVYDPRLDSTYPGGSGSCRATDETTWVYSENPWLHAITWALGRYQNGKRVLGVGLAAASIVLPSYVEAANIADANSWKVGGVVSSEDDKWNVLKSICQAGSGEPIRLGGQLSCRVDTPRVSLDTVTSADLVGSSSAAGTRQRKDRFNTAVARYRSEANGWQVVPTNPIPVSSYVTLDGGTRSKELDFPLVQQLAQAGQLATYQIVNAREFGPIMLQLKPRFAGYKPGDCLTLNIPELGLNAQLAIVTDRAFTPETGIVTLTFNSETASKHAFALGQTTTAPPAPSLTPRDLSAVPAPGVGAWTLSAAALTGTSSESIPVLHIAGAIDNSAASAVVLEYRVHGTSTWSNPIVLSPAAVAYDIPGLQPGSSYDVAISYLVLGVQGGRLVLGPATVGSLAGTTTTVTFSSTDVTINADSSGTILSGQLPMAMPIPSVIRGGVGVAGDNLTTYALSGVSTSLGSVTVDNTNGSSTKGQVTIPSGLTGSGSYFLTVSYNGTLVQTTKINVTIVNAAPVSSGGGGGSSGSFGVSDTVSSSASFVQVGSTVTVTKGTGQTIAGTFGDSYNVGGLSHSAQMGMKWRIAPTGTTTYTDMGSSVVGTAATSDNSFDQSPGSITCNQSIAPANGTYDVSLWAEKSGTGALTLDPATAYVSVS